MATLEGRVAPAGAAAALLKMAPSRSAAHARRKRLTAAAPPGGIGRNQRSVMDDVIGPEVGGGLRRCVSRRGRPGATLSGGGR